MHLPCRSYGPDAAVDGVIELGAGQAKSLSIQVGRGANLEEAAPSKPNR
jgi:uncharacterized membrane protein (UPF0127 family)